MPPFVHLSAADVAACGLAPAAMLDALEAAFLAQSVGAATTRPALSMPAGGPASFRAKGGVLVSAGYAAVKWYGYHPQNPAQGLPEYRPLILLSEAATGAPLALIDGTWITTVRTAAITAVGARHLAAPGADTAAFVGTGVQARANLDALLSHHPLRRILIQGRRPEPAQAFAAYARALGLQAEVVDDALPHAPIVVTTVPRLSPRTQFLDATRLAPGAFVSMVDSGVAWDPAGLRAFDTRIADDMPEAATHHEPGDATATRFDASLAGVVGARHPGRRHADERIALIFSGTGLADVAAAVAVYERARSLGLGTALAL